MSMFELPKPSIISTDSANGSGIEFHADSGVLSRTVHKQEQPIGEASRIASYRLGILPSGEVLASYDVHLPAGTASMTVYDNGDQEIGADFSIQAKGWSREQILAESVYTPGMVSTVVRGPNGMLGCTAEQINSTYFIELFELNEDKSIRTLHRALQADAHTVVNGVRIRHTHRSLTFLMDKMGYKTGIQIPLEMPVDSYMMMQEILHQPNPLDLNPLDVPIPKVGASVRFTRDDIYRI